MRDIKRNMYSEIAKSYDELHGEEQLVKYRIVKEFLKKYRHKDWVWLDIGSGTGLAQEFFKKEFKKALCIEPCKELIDIHLSQARPGIVINKKIEEIDLREKSIDICTSFTSLHHVENLREIIEKIESWTKKLVVVSMLEKSRKIKKFLEIVKNRETLLKTRAYKDILVIWKP